ncbi:hypothetical protein ACFOVU_24800 [Nocardiopsis sediminis]|uniref:DUF3558 domain-containing protein n=1 Tax=Nocardiopsis sediminis TaxID=1778267 RepID=A0ABV8FWB2_9ACTN
MDARVERLISEATATPARRWALAAGGVVVIAGVAIATGLVLGAEGPAVQAGGDDTYATAPGCDHVDPEAVESLLDGAELETAEHGRLDGADSATCVWTSVAAGDAAPRFLHVDLTAYYTDRSGEPSGSQAAAGQLEGLSPVADLEGAAPVPALGGGALVWPGDSGGTGAEVAFRRDNLVVRLAYGGDEGTGGTPLSYEDARDGAVALGEQVADSL